jgi:hypothetical protein
MQTLTVIAVLFCRQFLICGVRKSETEEADPRLLSNRTLAGNQVPRTGPTTEREPPRHSPPSWDRAI